MVKIGNYSGNKESSQKKMEVATMCADEGGGKLEKLVQNQLLGSLSKWWAKNLNDKRWKGGNEVQAVSVTTLSRCVARRKEIKNI